MFDVFVASMRCPACGIDVPDAEIQTYLRGGSADGSGLRLGFEFDAADLTTESIIGAGYALVSPPEPDGSIALLDVWTCSACGSEPWARVEIVSRKVRQISAVSLDRATLSSAHFISDTNARILADSLRGELTDLDAVEVLRRRVSE